MKKVMIVVPSFSVGGLEKCGIEAARILNSKYEVKLVINCSVENGYEEPDGIEIVDLNCPPLKGSLLKMINQIKRAWKLRNLRVQYKPNYVYAFGNTANLTVALSSFYAPGKNISSLHGYTNVNKCKYDEFAYRCSDAIVCTCKAMKFRLQELYPNLKNVVVIGNGYNIENILASRKSDYQVNLEGNPKFITVGRFDPIKGYDRLINAFAKVKKELPQSTLIFVGYGTMEGDLKEQVKNLGLEEEVQFTGYQSNPFKYLSEADVFVLSSYYEGFSNVTVEALACSLPVVAVDCLVGPREILSEEYSEEAITGIKEAEYGLLVENSDDNSRVADLLAEAMVKMATDTALREKYRAKAYTRACDFSIDVYADKLEKLFAMLDK